MSDPDGDGSESKIVVLTTGSGRSKNLIALGPLIISFKTANHSIDDRS